MKIDVGLLEFATDAQAIYVNAINKHGSIDKAAKALNRNNRSVTRSISSLKRAAAAKGYSPDHDLNHPQAPGYALSGTSTLYDANGNVKIQWVKSQQEKEQQVQSIIEAIQEACNGLPKAPKVKKPVKNNADLCGLYTLTDLHVGMLAWEDETGEAWDTDIVKKVLFNAFDDLMFSTPSTETAILNIMGDFLHFDSLSAITPASGHLLDADTRFAKIVKLALDLVYLVAFNLLKKHKRVHVKILEGNHDPASSIWLRHSIAKIFESEKRIDIDQSPFPYSAYSHGKTMLGFTHGHLKKFDGLAGIFASEPRFRKMWGNALYTYIHSGHFHSSKLIEKDGAIIEQHPTLAASDAYSSRSGYVSKRSAKSIVYHKHDGEVGRSQVVPRQD